MFTVGNPVINCVSENAIKELNLTSSTLGFWNLILNYYFIRSLESTLKMAIILSNVGLSRATVRPALQTCM